MAYIGRDPLYGGYESQILTADGSTTTYSLNFSVGTSSSLLVSVSGVFQQPETAYTLSAGGTKIVFSAAPANGETVFVIFLGFSLDAGNAVNTGSITSQTSLGAQPSAADTILIYDDSASTLKKVTYAYFIPTTHGDVSGPGSSTDNALARYDSTTGKVIQNSTATLTDAGTLTATAFAGALTGDVTGNVSGTAATVTGATQSAITALGTIASLVATTADINGGTFDGVVGGTTPAAVTTTSLVATTADINAGTFDGVVGGTTPAAGSFTTLTTTGAFTSLGIDDNADAVAITINSSENVGIGDTTPANKLSVTGSTDISGNLVIGATSTSHRLDIQVGTGSDVGLNIKSSGAAGNTARLTSNAGDDGQLSLMQSTGTEIIKLVGDASTENFIKATLNMYDNSLQRPFLRDYAEVKTNLSAAATIDIDLEEGNVFQCNPNQNTTFTFSNPPISGRSGAFTLVWFQDSTDRTITWPGAVDWPGGSAPDVTSGSGKCDIYTFFTLDAGTTWFGFQAGAEMS